MTQDLFLGGLLLLGIPAMLLMPAVLIVIGLRPNKPRKKPTIEEILSRARSRK